MRLRCVLPHTRTLFQGVLPRFAAEIFALLSAVCGRPSGVPCALHRHQIVVYTVPSLCACSCLAPTSTMTGVTSLDATRGAKKPAHGTTIARTSRGLAMAIKVVVLELL